MRRPARSSSRGQLRARSRSRRSGGGCPRAPPSESPCRRFPCPSAARRTARWSASSGTGWRCRRLQRRPGRRRRGSASRRRRRRGRRESARAAGMYSSGSSSRSASWISRIVAGRERQPQPHRGALSEVDRAVVDMHAAGRCGSCVRRSRAWSRRSIRRWR